MTWLAEPVLNRSGKASDFGAVAIAEARDGVGDGVGVEMTAEVGGGMALLVGAACPCVLGDILGDGDVPLPFSSAVQALTSSKMPITPKKVVPAMRTDLACHEIPIRMRGWALGVSHRMIEINLATGIETQPAVAPVPGGYT
jgi:hypothetical protein